MLNSSPLGLARQMRPQSLLSMATLPYIGLLGFTVIVVTSRWSGAELSIIVALAGLLIAGKAWRMPKPLWWGFGFLAWAYLTSFGALSSDVAQAAALDRLKVMCILLVVINALRSERQVQLYLLAFVGAFMIYPARGALVNYVHGETLFGRAIWNKIYSNPNDLAAMALLVLGCALVVATWRHQKRLIRIGAATCAAIILLVILLTQSRGAFIGLAVGFGPSLFARLFKRPKVVIYVAIGVIAGVSVLPHSLWVRLSGLKDLTSSATIAQADPEGSAAQRWEIQKTGWRIFMDHPLMGVGLGCYPIANARYSPQLGRRDTHDTYLNLAAELGLPGLVLWLGLVTSVLLKSIRTRNRNTTSDMSAAMIWMRRAVYAYLTAGLFGSYSGITMIYLVLGTLWCAAILPTEADAAVSGSVALRRQRSR